MKYTEYSIQGFLDTEWWVETSDKLTSRGSLIYAFVPYVDHTPYTFEPIGRKNPEEHDSAVVIAAPLRANAPLK